MSCGSGFLFPEIERQKQASSLAKLSGAAIEFETDVRKGDVDAVKIYTDVWVSMGEENNPGIQDRIESLRPYQVSAQMMAATGKSETIFLHCLPAHHTDGVHDMEVTEDVFA